MDLTKISLVMCKHLSAQINIAFSELFRHITFNDATHVFLAACQHINWDRKSLLQNSRHPFGYLILSCTINKIYCVPQHVITYTCPYRNATWSISYMFTDTGLCSCHITLMHRQPLFANTSGNTTEVIRHQIPATPTHVSSRIANAISLKTQTGRLIGSGEVQVHKSLYLGQYTTDSDEWTFFLHDFKCTRLWYSH